MPPIADEAMAGERAEAGSRAITPDAGRGRPASQAAQPKSMTWRVYSPRAHRVEGVLDVVEADPAVDQPLDRQAAVERPARRSAGSRSAGSAKP